MENEHIFVDYYDVLQVSPNAHESTIRSVFRYLAKKCHPDSMGGGNPELFRQLVKGYEILTDPEKRTAYDVRYQEYWDRRWQIVRQANNGAASADCQDTRERILTLLYVQRRTDSQHPGLGDLELARMIRLPIELMEFDLWYLRKKGLIERLDTGLIAISVDGVDRVEASSLRLSPDRLLGTSNVQTDAVQNLDLLGSVSSFDATGPQ